MCKTTLRCIHRDKYSVVAVYNMSKFLPELVIVLERVQQRFLGWLVGAVCCGLERLSLNTERH